METPKLKQSRVRENKMKTYFGKCQNKKGRDESEEGEKSKKVLQFFEGLTFSIVIIITTLITLFSDDLRQVFLPPQADLSFSVLTLVCMFIYFIELIALSILKEGYFLSYYFWLNLISTLSMIFDLMWVNELISGGGLATATSIAKLARASRASKIGAKSTKLIRFIRLVRILRLYKSGSRNLSKQTETQEEDFSVNKPEIRVQKKFFLQKKESYGNDQEKANQKGKKVSFDNMVIFSSQRKLSALHPTRKFKKTGNFLSKINTPIHNQPINEEFSCEKIQQVKIKTTQFEEEDASEGNPSKKTISPQLTQEDLHETMVGIKLKEKIQKNVITTIFLILISIPLLSLTTWEDRVTTYDKAIEQLFFYAKISSEQYDTQVVIFIENLMNLPDPLVFFSLQINTTCCQFPRDYSSYEVTSLDDLRADERYIVNYESSTVVFSKRQENILSAQLNLGRTLFICLLLIITTLLLSNDVDRHALQPLENMINTVKKISSDPLHAIQEIQKEIMIKKEYSEEDENEEKTETVILEQMIVKIASLLVVGFGEAGAQVIANNIQNNGLLKVINPGKKVMGIYGFCDIRNFTDATEVLEGQVMIFVNEIAEICHQAVYCAGGSPNKNVGDAFLLVWKFSEEDIVVNSTYQSTEYQLKCSLKVCQMADLAVYSFLKIISKITKSSTLDKYKKNSKLTERIKDYKGVKLGFGLHVGWSIEGPIGSEFKIDTSYLSPDANLSSRLQAATKAYGTHILISEAVHNLMTIQGKQILRQVDQVYVDNDRKMNLYTVDLATQNLKKRVKMTKDDSKSLIEKKKAKLINHQKRQELIKFINKKKVTNALWNDSDLVIMRQPFSHLFYTQWNKGLSNFYKGNWKEALNSFQTIKLLGPNHRDGPSQNLILFINEHKQTPPQNWKGVRNFCG